MQTIILQLLIKFIPITTESLSAQDGAPWAIITIGYNQQHNTEHEI